jgi:hypothetical protein
MMNPIRGLRGVRVALAGVALWTAGACSSKDSGTVTGGGGTGGAQPGSNNGGSGSSMGGASGSGSQSPRDGGLVTIGDGSAPAGPELTLPLTVTTHFNNQGWFGDDSLKTFFAKGLIDQSDSMEGPCGNASRDPSARGKCLKIVYTPPTGLMPPMKGAYVGVFLLTTLTMQHPELVPPASVGEANWGAEPGKNIAPGATKVTFFARADAPLTVVFKAGTDHDAFMLPDVEQMLTATWQKFTLALPASGYGNNVIGPFAWVLTNTAAPATFYVDGILWE